MQSKEWVAPFLAIPVLFLAFLLFGQRFGLLGQTNEFAEVEYELLLYDDSFVMDVENGRYYAKIKVDDKYKIGVFDADSLALMDVLEESGSFNVDQERDWFYVDDPKLGLTHRLQVKDLRRLSRAINQTQMPRFFAFV